MLSGSQGLSCFVRDSPLLFLRGRVHTLLKMDEGVWSGEIEKYGESRGVEQKGRRIFNDHDD